MKTKLTCQDLFEKIFNNIHRDKCVPCILKHYSELMSSEPRTLEIALNQYFSA